MSLRGRLESVSDVAKNQICHEVSAGNVACQERFVGELMRGLLRKDSCFAMILLTILAVRPVHRGRGAPR